MKTKELGRVLAISLTLGLAFTIAATGCGKSKAKREYEKMVQETARETAQEGLKQRARAEKEAEDQKRYKMEAQAKEEARLAASKKQEDEQEKSEKEDEAKVALTGKQEKAQKEKDVAAYADQRFSEVSLEPQVLLSPRAKALNLTTAFLGKDLPAYKKAVADKDWLGIMKLLDPRHAGEYEDRSSVDAAVRKMKEKHFQLLVNINPASVPKFRGANLLCCLTIPSVDDPDAGDGAWFGGYQNGLDRWEDHPDGTGLLHAWRPMDREIMLLVGKSPYPSEKGNVGQAAAAIDDAFRTARESLDRKVELGELAADGLATQLRELKTKKRESYLGLLSKF